MPLLLQVLGGFAAGQQEAGGVHPRELAVVQSRKDGHGPMVRTAQQVRRPDVTVFELVLEPPALNPQPPDNGLLELVSGHLLSVLPEPHY
jgi:hypothetical protein